MILYNVPLAGAMTFSLIERLMEIPNVKGLKFTGKDHDQMGQLIDRYGSSVQIYSGSDEMAFSGLSLGAAGIIGTFYNLMPELFTAIKQCVVNSEIQKGVRLQKIATEIIHACLPYDFISLLHNMMMLVGVDAGFSRKPFTRYKNDELKPLYQKLFDIKHKYNVTEVEFLNFAFETL